MKPILACDYDPKTVKFPMLAMPKIDGVRALNTAGRLVGRSGKEFKNRLNTEFFSDPRFEGFDGEMVVSRIAGDGICNETTSALGTIKGTVPTRWCLFDIVKQGANDRSSYLDRLSDLCSYTERLFEDDPDLEHRLWVVPWVLVNSIEEIELFDRSMAEQGYEGTILRDPEGVYKFGRCTAKESNYLRIKTFMDAEVEVLSVLEGNANHNEATSCPHGYTERATLAENMRPNGLVGTIIGRVLKDHSAGEKQVLAKDQVIEISPGKMPHEQRGHYFRNQHEIIGQIVKFKFFPVGIKDKPRFPTFQCFRSPEDL